MKKLAIFVEGQTESIFIHKLLVHIAGEKNIKITHQQKASGFSFYTLTGHSPQGNDDIPYYVLLRDCMGDEPVKADILNNLPTLRNENYSKIIGLRDVFPVQKEDIQKLQIGISSGLPSSPPTSIILAIMEIESWFIADNSHFEKVDSKLSASFIQGSISLSIKPKDVENIEHPAKSLREIYNLVGKTYTKKKDQIHKITEYFDYAELYLSLPQYIPSLKNFIDELDSFFN